MAKPVKFDLSNKWFVHEIKLVTECTVGIGSKMRKTPCKNDFFFQISRKKENLKKLENFNFLWRTKNVRKNFIFRIVAISKWKAIVNELQNLWMQLNSMTLQMAINHPGQMHCAKNASLWLRFYLKKSALTYTRQKKKEKTRAHCRALSATIDQKGIDKIASTHTHRDIERYGQTDREVHAFSTNTSRAEIFYSHCKYMAQRTWCTISIRSYIGRCACVLVLTVSIFFCFVSVFLFLAPGNVYDGRIHTDILPVWVLYVYVCVCV